MNKIEDIEQFAKDNYIPIARKKTVQFMIDIISKNNYKSFLEIGTAIGYTTIVLKQKFEYLTIVTIEKNQKRISLALDNFKDFNLLNKISFLQEDALNYQLDDKFDLIFIDAAKKKNKFFLEKFKNNLNANGTIIIDNMNLDDLWTNAKQKKKDYYDKINQELISYLSTNNEYEVTFHYDIGDGIAVIKLK